MYYIFELRHLSDGTVFEVVDVFADSMEMATRSIEHVITVHKMDGLNVTAHFLEAKESISNGRR